MNTTEKDLDPRDLLKLGRVARVRFPHGNEMVGIIIGYRLQGSLDEHFAIYEGGNRAFYLSKNVEIIKIVDPVSDDTLVRSHYEKLLMTSDVVYQKKEAYDAINKIMNIGDNIVYPIISSSKVRYQTGKIIDMDNMEVRIKTKEGDLVWKCSDQLLKI